jgi:hypothetical protein
MYHIPQNIHIHIMFDRAVERYLDDFDKLKAMYLRFFTHYNVLGEANSERCASKYSATPGVRVTTPSAVARRYAGMGEYVPSSTWRDDEHGPKLDRW